jgi:hypothetical protein
MVIRNLLAFLVILGLFAACASKAPPKEQLPAWKGEVVSHYKVVIEGQNVGERGIVGWVKVFRYSRPGFGPPYDLYHVYDTNFKEVGFISPRGTATKYIEYRPGLSKVVGREHDTEILEAQPLEWNVAKLLELDAKVRVVPATPQDPLKE